MAHSSPDHSISSSPEMRTMDTNEREIWHEPSSPALSPEIASTSNDDSEPEAETPKMTHDSMVTVRLSEPPILTLNTTTAVSDTVAEKPAAQPAEKGTSLEDDSNESGKHNSVQSRPRDSVVTLGSTEASRSLQEELGECGSEGQDSDSSGDEEVDWEQLEKTEDEQMKDEETDNVRSPELLFKQIFPTESLR